MLIRELRQEGFNILINRNKGGIRPSDKWVIAIMGRGQGRISKYDIALGGLMKIRDHPSLIHWPPEWIASFDNESLSIVKREELVLKEVELLSTPPNYYHSYIRLSAEHQRKIWKTYRSMKTLKTYKNLKPEKPTAA